MSLTSAQLKQLTQNKFVDGLFRHDAKVAQLHPLMSIQGVKGPAIEFPTYTQANWGEAHFITAGAAPTPDEAAPDDPNTEVDFSRVVYETVIPGFYADAYTGGDEPANQQEEIGRIAVHEAIAGKLINGDHTTHNEEFDGLIELLDSNFVVGANDGAADGGPLTLADIDRMMNKMRSGREKYLIGNETVMVQFLELMRSAGWQPEFRWIEELDDYVPCYRKVAFLIDNYIGSSYSKGSGTNLTYLLGVVPGWAKGVSYITPEGREEQLVQSYRYRKEGTDNLIIRLTASIGLVRFQKNVLVAVDGIATT